MKIFFDTRNPKPLYLHPVSSVYGCNSLWGLALGALSCCQRLMLKGIWALYRGGIWGYPGVHGNVPY